MYLVVGLAGQHADGRGDVLQVRAAPRVGGLWGGGIECPECCVQLYRSDHKL